VKTIKIIIPGPPTPRHRPRFSRRGTYSDQARKKTRFQFYAIMQVGRILLLGPLSVKYSFFMPRPKSHSRAGKLRPSAPKHHTKTPYIDDLREFAADCLKGIAYKDDSQIVKSQSLKQYSNEPRTEIEVREL